MTFDEIKKGINVYTAVDDRRLKVLHELVLKTKHLGHFMAEIGVYKGGSSYLITNTDENRPLYCCDSFEGLPELNNKDYPENLDYHQKGDFNDVSYKEVKSLLNFPQVKIIKGWFPNKIDHEKMYKRKYSFVHLDVDLYDTTLESLKFFYERMVPGGILVCDDYKFPHCPGIEKAFNTFMKDKPEKLIDTNAYSCYFIKGK